MSKISNPAAPIDAPAAPSAGSVTTPGGAPFPPSTHPALAGATGGARVASIATWPAVGARATPKR
jgi:hypothetical protein